MGRIYCLMGKSASGKDTVYKELLRRFPGLRTYVMYSTRPMREGEKDGVTYHFVDEDRLRLYEEQGKLIEKRVYQTMLGPWTYATVDDGQIDPEGHDILMLTTPEAFIKLCSYFGRDRVRDIYIEVEDGERLLRAIKREMLEPRPHYDEVCRRFLADCEDFSEERLQEAGIERRYDNQDLEECIQRIAGDMEHEGF